MSKKKFIQLDPLPSYILFKYLAGIRNKKKIYVDVMYVSLASLAVIQSYSFSVDL